MVGWVELDRFLIGRDYNYDEMTRATRLENPELEARVQRVHQARRRVVDFFAARSERQGSFHPSPERWSLQQICEHLVHAEEIGINFVWMAAEALEQGTPSPEFSGEHTNAGLSIERVVEKTWKEKETAPDVAAPRIGGPLAYWTERLRGCEATLDALARRIEPLELTSIVYPHVLSGPLDAGQRIDFLRFHLERHERQARDVMAAPGFPD